MNADGTLNAYDGTIDTDQLATAAFYQESRLSQFDANGNPLTSPKGAVGIAQVMKETGPEAAEAAGLKWDENAWRNDPAYNLALGKAYLNKQLKAFGGNQVLALAAYNAGPGRVNEWLAKYGDPRTGAITNEDFVRSIPFPETQNYVTKIMESVPSVPKTATMAAITDTPYFHQLSPQDQSRALSGMAEILNKQRQASRVVLDGIVNDASAALRNGEQPQVLPSHNQLISSYGLVQGGQIFTQLQNDEAFGNNVRLVKNIPPAQQQQLLEQAKPEPGPNYAERRKNYDQLSTAINAVNTARTADPIAFGMREGMVSSLDFTNAETLTQTLKSRYNQAVQLSGNYGTPISLLTKQEASQLASMVKGADPDVAINFLKNAGSVMGPDGLRALSVQVAPNSASTAYASIILGAPDNQYNNRSGVISYDQFIGYKPTMDKYEVTKTILLGDQLINPTSIQKKAGMQAVALPSDDKLRQEFDDAVGTAFQYNPQARQMAYSVFKSAYAGLTYTSKDTDDLSTKSVNSDLAEKAVKYATGGVYQDFNGGDVVMPFGMDKSTFKDRYSSAAHEALSRAGLNPGAVGNFRPVNVGDNQYRLVAGSGRWAVDPRTGSPIVVRVQ
ncbi:hypothetical protein BIY27_25020 [Gibbsiella quercinecans]|nr:hypothetical protein BIY27_25020 [Gibbsiella quercinecans]